MNLVIEPVIVSKELFETKINITIKLVSEQESIVYSLKHFLGYYYLKKNDKLSAYQKYEFPKLEKRIQMLIAKKLRKAQRNVEENLKLYTVTKTFDYDFNSIKKYL